MFDKRFSQACAEVLCARDAASLHQAVLRCTHALGFEHFGGFIGLDRAGGSPMFRRTVEHIPAGFESLYACARRSQRNPVAQHLKHHHTPIEWDQAYFVRHQRAEMWEELAGFGYRAGVSCAMHLPGGRHHAFGLSGPSPLDARPDRRMALAATVQWLGTQLHEASARLLFPVAEPRQCLTERERECLQWALAGKTAWETGRILSLSERSIGAAFASAMRKLDCVNKHQAAARASRLGLLD